MEWSVSAEQVWWALPARLLLLSSACVTIARPLTAPAASAPASGASAMTVATVAFLMAVSFLNSGVYSSVAAAEKATMLRSWLGSMRHAAIRQPQ